MCSKGFCSIWSLGENGAQQLCVGDVVLEPGKPKTCPVLLVSFGYEETCDEKMAESCPVRRGEFQGICPYGRGDRRQLLVLKLW